VFTPTCPCYQPGGSILNSLQTLDEVISDAVQHRVAVVQAAGIERLNGWIGAFAATTDARL